MSSPEAGATPWKHIGTRRGLGLREYFQGESVVVIGFGAVRLTREDSSFRCLDVLEDGSVRELLGGVKNDKGAWEILFDPENSGYFPPFAEPREVIDVVSAFLSHVEPDRARVVVYPMSAINGREPFVFEYQPGLEES